MPMMVITMKIKMIIVLLEMIVKMEATTMVVKCKPCLTSCIAPITAGASKNLCNHN